MAMTISHSTSLDSNGLVVASCWTKQELINAFRKRDPNSEEYADADLRRMKKSELIELVSSAVRHLKQREDAQLETIERSRLRVLAQEVEDKSTQAALDFLHTGLGRCVLDLHTSLDEFKKQITGADADVAYELSWHGANASVASKQLRLLHPVVRLLEREVKERTVTIEELLGELNDMYESVARYLSESDDCLREESSMGGRYTFKANQNHSRMLKDAIKCLKKDLEDGYGYGEHLSSHLSSHHSN